MTEVLTNAQNSILKHMWDCRFARSMTLTDFSQRTINSLIDRGFIAWDHDADARRTSGPAMYGLTAYGVSHCKAWYADRKQGGAK